MAKLRSTIECKLPAYGSDKYSWRREILECVRRECAQREIQIDREKADLEVVVLLYLKKGNQEAIHDVDNRLKDILDALQGRFGGPKTNLSVRSVASSTTTTASGG